MATFSLGSKLENPALVDEMEGRWGSTLPNSYKSIVLVNNGACMDDAECRFINPQSGAEEVIGCDILIPFGQVNSGAWSMDRLNDRDIVSYLPKGVIFFGKEAGGYLFGFDYREHPETDNPPVVLFHMDNDEEFACFRVADDFDSFLAALGTDTVFDPQSKGHDQQSNA